METYTVIEKQNLNSHREGVRISAKNLTQAKRKASNQQAFFGTVLSIEDKCGFELSRKVDGKWTDSND